MTDWPSPTVAVFFGILTFALQYFLPLLVMLFTYSAMLAVIRKRAKIQVQQAQFVSTQPNKSNKSEQIQRNILKTLASVSLLFILCWTWNQIFIFLFYIGVPVEFGTFYKFATYMAFTNCAVNPVVYCAQYKYFREQCKALVGKLHKNDDGSSTSSTKDDCDK